MADWVPSDEFDSTKYGQLNQKLNGKHYFGPLDREKMPPNSTIVKDPKDGCFGILVDERGEPIGKVDLID